MDRLVRIPGRAPEQLLLTASDGSLSVPAAACDPVHAYGLVGCPGQGMTVVWLWRHEVE